MLHLAQIKQSWTLTWISRDTTMSVAVASAHKILCLVLSHTFLLPSHPGILKQGGAVTCQKQTPIIGWSISLGSMLVAFTTPPVSFPVLGKFYHWWLLLFLKVKHNPIVWSLVPYHVIPCKINPSLGDWWWWCTKLWVSPENSSLRTELATDQETGQAMDIMNIKFSDTGRLETEAADTMSCTLSLIKS